MVAAVSGGPPIIESRLEVDGVGVFVRRTEGEGPPVVFSHGNPTDSGDWIPFLQRLSRPGIAFDHPGWGRSDAPSAKAFDYSMNGLARFFGRVLDELGVDEHALLVHDWGALALIDAIARPERLEKLVVMNAVALLPAYKWHRLARLWRTPLVGELVNATISKPVVRVLSPEATGDGRRIPEWFVDRLYGGWRGAKSAAILGLYRSADPPVLAAAGRGLERIECPALVVWGRHDPYIPPRFAPVYAERLGNADLLELPDAGHWPWLDRPDLLDTVCGFLDRPATG